MFKIGFEKTALKEKTVERAAAKLYKGLAKKDTPKLTGRMKKHIAGHAEQLAHNYKSERPIHREFARLGIKALNRARKDLPYDPGKKGYRPSGLVKKSGIMKLPKPKVNPITVQDALGASKATPFSKALSHFGSGHHPRPGLKAMSKVRHGA